MSTFVLSVKMLNSRKTKAEKNYCRKRTVLPYTPYVLYLQYPRRFRKC